MKVRWLRITLLLALLMGAVAAPVEVQAQSSDYTVPMTGEAATLTGDSGLFIGSLRITSFDRDGSTVLVKGVLDGEISYGERSTIGNIRRDIALPILSIEGGCEGVYLGLEALPPEGSDPLLLLSPVALEDRSQPGASKQLGDLLCAVGELGDTPPANRVANLLNRILRALS